MTDGVLDRSRQMEGGRNPVQGGGAAARSERLRQQFAPVGSRVVVDLVVARLRLFPPHFRNRLGRSPLRRRRKAGEVAGLGTSENEGSDASSAQRPFLFPCIDLERRLDILGSLIELSERLPLAPLEHLAARFLDDAGYGAVLCAFLARTLAARGFADESAWLWRCFLFPSRLGLPGSSMLGSSSESVSPGRFLRCARLRRALGVQPSQPRPRGKSCSGASASLFPEK